MHPYFLHQYNNRWYLFGLFKARDNTVRGEKADTAKDGIRCYAPDRISDKEARLFFNLLKSNPFYGGFSFEENRDSGFARAKILPNPELENHLMISRQSRENKKPPGKAVLAGGS
ncbi:MAG: hypothetical protein IJ222_02140 [Bacteroidales bacterium]|nr:hypothetical protein [Bacteroidales bacterium]